jgi:hypothetical protein
VGSLVAVARTGKCAGIPLETFSKVVESIYDCALEPNHWPETLRLIVDRLISQYGILGVQDLSNLCAEMTFQVGIDAYYHPLVEEKYAAMNPYVTPIQLVPVGQVVTSAMLFLTVNS